MQHSMKQKSYERADGMNTYKLTASVTAAANAIACKLNDDEPARLAAVPVQLGDTLATIATQRAVCADNK